jgi:hypothetical protein
MKAAHTSMKNERPREGGALTHSKWVDKHSKAGRDPARMRQTQIRVTKTSKSKTKINTHEGAQHNANETRIKTITTQTQNIKHLSGLHIRKDQRGPPPQREGT